MKLLVLGDNSQLGLALTALLQARQLDFVAVSGDALNTLNQSELIRILSKAKATQVLNVATYGNLVTVEADSVLASKCDEVNSEGLSMLAENCKKMELPLLHHSSSLVFDGHKLQPYSEGDSAEPLSRYGLSKWYGERSIRDTHEQHVILRTDWLFGPERKAYFRKYIDSCKANSGQVEVMHHRFSPTPAEDAARVMLAIAHQVDCRANAWGTYHYCALQAVNQEQFVEGFLQQAGELDPVLQKTLKNLELKLQDSEPPYIANSALDCSHIMATFGIKQRPRGEAVTAMINSLYGKKTKR